MAVSCPQEQISEKWLEAAKVKNWWKISGDRQDEGLSYPILHRARHGFVNQVPNLPRLENSHLLHWNKCNKCYYFLRISICGTKPNIGSKLLTFHIGWLDSKKELFLWDHFDDGSPHPQNMIMMFFGEIILDQRLDLFTPLCARSSESLVSLLRSSTSLSSFLTQRVATSDVCQ